MNSYLCYHSMESKKKGKKTVGDKVRHLRSKIGLTQDQLARQCDIPYTTLTKLESNVITKPSVQTVEKIAKGLNMTIDDILKSE